MTPETEINDQSSKDKPVVYILHGDDLLAMEQHLEEIKKSAVEEGSLETSLTQYDCRTAREEEIRASVMALPFLTTRRIVILTNPLAKLEAKKDNEDESGDAVKESRRRFLTMLERLPQTTALVLVIPDQYQGKKGWLGINDNHWFRKWISAAGVRASYQACRLPPDKEMPEWIRSRAKSQHGQFSTGAAMALAELVGNDTLLAQQEIDKLLTYVDLQRPVEKEDVDRLCSAAQGDVFDMVDAIGKKDKKAALRQLHSLLEHEDGRGLFYMTVRQFRLLLQVRDLIDNGGTLDGASSELRKTPPFLLNRLRDQARRFSMAQLEDIYHRLLEMDEAIKKSQMTAELALDTLITEIGK